MATIPPLTKPQAARQFRHWRLTVDKYLRMIKLGILTEQDRVFLWKGQLLEKMTKERPHIVTVQRLWEALNRVVTPHACCVEKEDPMKLVNRKDTIPEPDVKVVRGRREDYADIPTSRDVPLVVEVADTTLPFDRGPKQRLYAAESIPEYWVASVNGPWIEVFTQPSGPQSPTGYQVRQTYRKGESVPVRLDGNVVGHVPVDEIFP
jgi:Putative restriction endonuclease